jgi:hypothetical protein
MEADEDLIQSIINRNIVYTLLKYLDLQDHPHIIYESAWCIANLASGNKHQIQSMVDKGLWEYLPKILNSPHNKIYEQGAWIVGNISADADIFRRKLVDMDCIQVLSSKILNSSDYETIKFTTWALGNLVRGRPINKKKEGEALLPLLRVMGVKEILNDKKVPTLIEAKIPERLIVIARRGVTHQLFAICQILSHISFGEYEYSNKIIECGFLPILFDILKSETYSVHFKKEILWTLSNLTIGEHDQMRAVLSNIDRFNILMSMCKHKSMSVRK